MQAETGIADRAAAGGTEKEQYVRRIFSEIAPRYDFLNHLLSLNIDRGWRRKAIAALEWQRDPAGVYLDLCAGTLDVSLMLSRQSGFHGSVLGVDFAEPMLRAGLPKTRGQAIAPVAGDALLLPLPDGSVSGAIVAFGIRNVAALDAGLREVHRVLREGGRFVILEFSTPRAPVLRSLYLFYFRRVLPLLGRIVSGHPTAYSYLPASVANFPDEGSLAALLREAGFASATWRSLTFGVAAIHVGVKA